jgi:hypothetical protein
MRSGGTILGDRRETHGLVLSGVTAASLISPIIVAGVLAVSLPYGSCFRAWTLVTPRKRDRRKAPTERWSTQEA